jgi:peptidoglycan/LPS O-acetylase OafA/YrhL
VKNDCPNLNFLRSFAVLLVVGHHLSSFFGKTVVGPLDLAPLGHLGVMYFFVHTCLVLMLSLERQQAAQGNDRLFFPFMIRRFFRIYPLSMLAVLVVTVLALPMGEISSGRFIEWRADFGDVLSNLFLVQNLSYRVSILGPMWSLAFEMEMYLLLPGLFIWVSIKRAWWSIPLLLVAAIFLNWAVKLSTPTLLLYLPGFLPGILAFMLQKKLVPKIPSWAWLVFVVAISIAYSLSRPSLFYRRYVVYLICLLLGLAIPLFMPMTNRVLVLASRVIAKYSYGIYLAHFACIWLAFEKLGSLPMGLKILIFLFTVTTIPMILFHAIEDPCLKFGKKVSDTFASDLSPVRNRDTRMGPVGASV